MISNLGAFVTVAAVVIVTPGPDTALIVRNALFGGRRDGILTAAGVVTGLATWAVAACTGAAALLQASAPAFLALKLAGAAYLAYLGVRSLVRALRRHGDAEPSGPQSSAPAFRQGLFSNLGNPKIAVFFVSLLPQFTPGGHASFASLLVLGLIFCAMGLVWLTAYAVLVARAGALFRHGSVARALDGLTGAVLVALGVRLATEPR